MLLELPSVFIFSHSFYRDKYNTKRLIEKNISIIYGTFCADSYLHIGPGFPRWMLKYYSTMLPVAMDGQT